MASDNNKPEKPTGAVDSALAELSHSALFGKKEGVEKCSKCKDGEYCGTCDVCGKPGHIRGLMFYTGCFCDPHYEEAAKKLDEE